MEQFTKKAASALKLAAKAARRRGHSYIGSEHLLLGLLEEGEGTAAQVLIGAGVEEEKLKSLIDQLIAPEGGVGLASREGYTPRASAILENSVREAELFHMEQAGTEHILLTIIKDPECVATRLLHTMGVNLQKLYRAILDSMGIPEEVYREMNQGARNANRSEGGNTPTLEQYSRDLTALAEEGKLDPVVGREQEIERIMEILSRRTKNNPCLVGGPGVGKTAIVEGLAQRIAMGAVPAPLQNRRLLTLDMASMVAGSKYRGEFEERIKRVIKEAEESQEVLLFIDELHTIIGAGGAEGAMDASNILKPSLARGEIQLIGATTIEEYRKYIEKDPALERRFQPVTVEEPTMEETVEILKGLRKAYEKHHGVVITDEAVQAAVTLSERYINDRFLPDKAIDLLDEAAARKQLQGYKIPKALEELKNRAEELEELKEAAIVENDFGKAADYKKEQVEVRQKFEQQRKRLQKKAGENATKVREEDIAEVVALWTRIPVQRLAEKESHRLLKLEHTLHQRVVGQDEAVQAVAKAIRRGRVGLKDPKRPIGSFLFLGPTGVGKTELSKTLAEVVFGSEQAMIRVDMSEYMEKHSVSKLIGSPPGYVGYEEGGQLSERIRRNPYSVLLFDEIEKAHPDVFNILLQVLDDGQITDAHGRKVSFKNTVIIMTSNCGAANIMSPKRLGFGASSDAKANYEQMKAKVMEDVKQSFKPEFLNRIDEIIVFHPLYKEDMKAILDIMLRSVTSRVMENMELKLKVTDEAQDYLIDKGFDEKYGARPLRRALQTYLEDSMAEEILEGRIERSDSVTVEKGENGLKFSVRHKRKTPVKKAE